MVFGRDTPPQCRELFNACTLPDEASQAADPLPYNATRSDRGSSLVHFSTPNATVVGLLVEVVHHFDGKYYNVYAWLNKLEEFACLYTNLCYNAKGYGVKIRLSMDIATPIVTLFRPDK